MDKDYYVPQDSEWHRKNRGEIFTHNGALQYMTVTDIFRILTKSISSTNVTKRIHWSEIKDGMYEEANKSYYMSYNPDYF